MSRKFVSERGATLGIYKRQMPQGHLNALPHPPTPSHLC